MQAKTLNYYLPAIDGLRSVAVLAVMIYHLNPAWLPGGFAGVDVFFVISGYVVARSLKNHTGETLGVFLAGFYSRRIRRIMPALLLCLLVTTLLTVLFVPASWLSSTTSQVGLYSFFGLSNIALVLFQDNYFSPRAEFNPFVHTWSLGVEEQFYLIFPFLAYLFFRFSRSSFTAARAVSISLIPLLAALSLFAAYYMGNNKPDWAYYILPSRFWELAAGVLLFSLHDKFNRLALSARATNAFILLGLTLITLGYVWSDVKAFPYPWALLPVLGTVFTIHGIANSENRAFSISILSTSTFVYIGKLSYSLYLWHWPIFTLFRWTLGLESSINQVSAVLITFIMAAASYHFIECPVRKAKILALPAYRGLLAGGVATLLVWGGAWQIFQEREQLSLSRTADTWVWYPYAYPDHEPVKPNNLTDTQLFVIGNSHTGAYSTMLSLLEQRQGVRVHKLETGHCAVGNILYPVDNLAGCEGRIDHYVSVLEKQAESGDIVFFASLRTYRLSDQWTVYDPEHVLAHSSSQEALDTLGAAYTESSNLIRRLEKMGLKVLIDAPKPVLKGPPYRCSDWFNRMNPVCGEELAVGRAYMETLRSPVMSSLQRLDDDHENVFLWDPLPALCGDNSCSAYTENGQPLFFDGDHLSGTGNRRLYPGFEEAMLRVTGTTLQNHEGAMAGG